MKIIKNMVHLRGSLKAVHNIAKKCCSLSERVLRVSRRDPRNVQVETQTSSTRGQRATTTATPAHKDARRTDLGTLTLQITPDLSSVVKDALLADRRGEWVEVQIKARMESLGTRINELDRQIFDMDYHVEEINIAGKPPDQERILRMRKDIQVMGEVREGLEESREQTQKYLSNVYDGQRIQQAEFIAALDELCVTSNMLPPRRDIRVAQRPESPISSSTLPELLEQKTAKQLAMILPPESAGDQRQSERSLRCQVGIDDLRQAATDPSGTPENLGKPTLDPGQDLKRNYLMQKLFLGQAEEDFESRGDRFDQEYEELRHALVTGEASESVFAFDMRQLREAQRLTRALADAELEFCAAKEAAVAGGVEVPGSDVESGFIDMDDRYRMSFERDMAASVDQAWIQRWMVGLPDTPKVPSTGIAPLMPVSGPIDELAEEIEIDDWGAKSIDICESLGMRAEGPSRRRIDRWKAACYIS